MPATKGGCIYVYLSVNLIRESLFNFVYFMLGEYSLLHFMRIGNLINKSIKIY